MMIVLVPPFLRYNTEALKAEMERYNNKVADEVTLLTTVVVIGDGVAKPDEEPAILRARELGVPMLRESEVADYIGLE